MYCIKSLIAGTVLFVGVISGTANAADPPQMISGDSARSVWDNIQATGGAFLIDRNIYDDSGHLLGQYIKEVKTYNAVGTENGNPEDGRVALYVTFDEPKWVPVTTYYPIYWWNANTCQWVYYQTYEQGNAQVTMNNLVATYGNIFQYGTPSQYMVYPQPERATSGSASSDGGTDGSDGGGILGQQMGTAPRHR